MTPLPHKMQDDLRDALAGTPAPRVRGTVSDAKVRYPVARPETGSYAPRLLSFVAISMAAAAGAIAYNEPLILLAAGGGLGVWRVLGVTRAWLAARKATASRPRAATSPTNEIALDRTWESGEGTAQMTALFDALGDMFVITSPQGRITAANATFRREMGCNSPEGLTLAEAGVVPEHTAAGLELHLGSGDAAKTWTWHQTAARDLLSGDLRVHTIGRDVTADRKAEAALIDARAKAEAASEAKTRFLATVSHEVRTPLNGILGMTHLLGQTQVTPEQASYLKTVRESGHSLLSLIEDLLDATSIEAGRFHLRHGECDPHELVQTTCELMAAQAHEKNIEIASHIAADVPHSIVSDAGRLKQVLFNLIGNAIKFTAHGGIRVDVRRRGDMLEISVTDTGPGLKPEDHKRIFEEFERADNSSTRRYGGAGLGLSISARIIAALGGTIDVESEPGKGSRFHFSVPLNAEDLSDCESAGADTVTLAGKVALIVAPDGPVASALVQSITELGGEARAVSAIDDLGAALDALQIRGTITDLLIDRRVAADNPSLRDAAAARVGDKAERTLIIAPEDSRDLRVSPDPTASKWLVRPVRMRSLVSVLTTRDDRADRSRASGAIATPALIRPSDTPTFDILLAEDNPVNALVVRTMLARDGHRVTLVEDGLALVDEALERPDGKARYDLVITDISMPELDGTEAIEKIRAGEVAEGFKRLPIIVLSADGHSGVRDVILAAGADGHAEKPVDPAWLASLVGMTAGNGRRARA